MAASIAPELQWVRPPVQGRSAQTLARLLDATERLLKERSFDQLTVAEIAKEASSSVGSFYARFEGKEALLRALHERYVQESVPTSEDALSAETWVGVPLAVALERVCTFIVHFTWEHRGLKRALVVACAQDAEFRARSSELAGFVVKKIEALLEARRSEVGHPDLPRAADFLHRLVFSYLDQLVAFGEDDPIQRPRPLDELAEDLAAACAGFLQLKEAPR